MAKKIGVLVGSLRKESWNRKLAVQLMKLAEGKLDMELIEIGELPHYNEDIDHDTPPATYTHFRQQLAYCEGFLFVTPEYNRGLPGVIKNALDVGSRPYGQSKWNGKPAAVVTASTGNVGGFGANHALRQSMVFLNVPMMQQPEAYLGDIAHSFAEDGSLNERTRGFAEKFLGAFAEWVGKF